MCFFKALLQFVTSEKTRHHGKFTKHPVAGCKFNFIQHAFLNAWVFGHRNVLHPFFFGDDNWNFIASGKKIHLVGGAEGFLGNIHPGSVIVFPIDLSHGVPAISEGEQATQQLATRSPNGTNMDKLWTNKKHWNKSWDDPSGDPNSWFLGWNHSRNFTMSTQPRNLSQSPTCKEKSKHTACSPSFGVEENRTVNSPNLN